MDLSGAARRPLHLTVLMPCSACMRGTLIRYVDYAIRVMIDHLAAWDADQDQVQVLIRVIAFATTARWHVASPVPASQLRLEWEAPEAVMSGRANMGPAFRLAASALAQDRAQRDALRPVLLLITAGGPTDFRPEDLLGGLAALLDASAGRQAVRLAAVIRDDEATAVAEAFAHGPDGQILVARDLEDVPPLLLQAAQIIISTAKPQPGQQPGGNQEPEEIL